MIEPVESHPCFGGVQAVYRHRSAATGVDMTFAVFTPPQEGPRPVLTFLSGLTCTHANVMEKGGYQRVAAELGLIVVCPDTSPRGAGVPDDPQGAYDFGLGAGFYLDATQAPWSANYRMETYVTAELPEVVAANFPVQHDRQGLTGHSMGGHGAITLALKNPRQWKSVSAFAPIASPMRCPWGEKALSNYLGADRAAWRRYDATALIEDGARLPDLLVDQGLGDNFLETQLKPDLLEDACHAAGVPLTLRRQAGYDHSYYFISTFMEDHLRWHWSRLASG